MEAGEESRRKLQRELDGATQRERQKEEEKERVERQRERLREEIEDMTLALQRERQNCTALEKRQKKFDQVRVGSRDSLAPVNSCWVVFLTLSLSLSFYLCSVWQRRRPLAPVWPRRETEQKQTAERRRRDIWRYPELCR